MLRVSVPVQALCVLALLCSMEGSGQPVAGRGVDGGSIALPEAPRARVDTSLPPMDGRAIRVSANGDAQDALDRARPGDTVILEAGATYAGTFTLRKKSGKGWVFVVSSARDRLPPAGGRVKPPDARHMARLVTNRNGQPALRVERGAHNFRLIGLEFTAAPSVKKVGAIVEVAHRSANLEDVPSHIIFDRVYIHGSPDLQSRRGLTLNARWSAVVDSWIAECHTHGFDSQAIVCWNGPGPFRIENNFLEGGSENIMFGGAKNKAENLVPSDIVIRRNHLYKNPAWAKLHYPKNWAVKNLFEIKTARRVLFEANVLENCWSEAQTGFAFVLKSSSPSQGQPWDTTSDLTIRRNRVTNCLNGFAVARWSSSGPVIPGAEPTSRLLIEHNVFEQFGEACEFADTGRGGLMFQIAGRDFTIRHNTAWNGHSIVSLTKPGTDNLAFLDNLVTPGRWGVKPDGGGVGWNHGIGSHIRGSGVMRGNAIVRVGSDRARRMPPKAYPPGNLWFDSFEAAGADPKTYRLLPDSKARGAATDGADPGADVEAVMAATEGVRSQPPR